MVSLLFLSIIKQSNRKSLIIMNEEVNVSKVQEPITSASPEICQIIERVLSLEKSKLSLRSPRNINDDIVQIIKEVIQ